MLDTLTLCNYCEKKCDQKNGKNVCQHFTAQPSVLIDFQRARLLAQILTQRQSDFLLLSIKSKQVKFVDKKNEPLALGNYIKFRFGLHDYVGTIVSYNLQKHTLQIESAIFKSLITLHPAQVEKISTKEAKEILFSLLSDKNKKSIEWHMECLVHEILTLKSKASISVSEQKLLFQYEERFDLLDEQLKFDILLKNL